ncbi:CHAP domain-containing protein [Enterococcus montenegrensis]|uniref:CHAP domain-containing protein n=1 Tax=Enterococcus montenegrensis TaxID=3031993 RepID=UPI00249F6A83|nr:CHAP domain-containing protein [Enterococcus montenegrensis]WHA08802.1 CHAP domain-containing protein [Enterococcus montenegrensis]
MNKGLNHLQSLIGQPIGNHQCYALSAEYAGIMDGPGMGAMTKYDINHQIGNVWSAAEIGSAYDWTLYGWHVIVEPTYEQLVTGAIINWKLGARVSEDMLAPRTFGHTGVIKSLLNHQFQTYEQNAELGEIVVEYNRNFFDSSQISSICIPPDFEKGVINIE